MTRRRGSTSPTHRCCSRQRARGGREFRGLELQDDVADALQFLLGAAEDPPTGPTVPFAHALALARPINEVVGRPTPLDGSAWYLCAEDVREAALALARVSGRELASRYDPGALEESGLFRISEDFEQLEPWTREDLPVLEQAYAALVAYFQQAAELRHGMLVLLEDGPCSSLDLDLA